MNSYKTVKNKFEGHFVAKRNNFWKSKVQHSSSKWRQSSWKFHRQSALFCQILQICIVRLENKKLQVDPNLTLEKVTAQPKQSEEVKKQQSFIHKDQTTGNQQHNIDNIGEEQGSKFEGIKCTQCLGPQHSRQKCPASKSLCNNWFRKGHWDKACQGKSNWSKRIGKIHQTKRTNYFWGK